ncbi:MAG: DUF624 domain-containing protein [Clostridiales bacterium]|jgi:uncharacterized membrane protein YesL|nr:DUF624 domain-containing protein [Clostridiales bacterium]
MREFFSLEGTFNKYAGFVADMFILSFLWIFFSIPIITIGASTTALFYVCTRRIANREGYISSDFWSAFKTNFVKATVLWFIISAVVLAIGFNMMLVVLNPELMSSMRGIVLPAQIVLLMEVLFISIYIFPVTARFDMKILQTIKTCFFMANRHILTSFACLAVLVLLFASVIYMQPMLFLIPGIYAMAASYLIMKIFKRYRPEMDRDPILELQEIEQKRAEEKRLAEIGKHLPHEGEKINEEEQEHDV